MRRPEVTIDLPPAPHPFTVKQTAWLTGMNSDTIYEAIAADRCPWPVLRVGRVIRIPRSAVLASIGESDREPDCEP